MGSRAVIEFRTLGAIELNRGDDPTTIPLVSRSKMLGLLAYVAVKGQGAVLRREELCHLFWPESDERRGRNALNQTLHALRSSLGRDLIVGGRKTVGLDSDRIRCDAVELLHALSREDWQTAIDLYRGRFLPGFHVGGAPDFERWADEQRAVLKRRAFEAARHLARSWEDSGNDRESISALRRARAIRPEDDDTVREIIAACLRLGNVGVAIREFENYRSFLRNEFSLEPPAETAALYEEIVGRHAFSGTDGPADLGPEEVVASGSALDQRDDVSAAPVVASRTGGRKGANAPASRYGRLVPVAVVVVGLVTIVSLFMGTNSRFVHPALDDYRIAVLPVRVSSLEDHEAARKLARVLDGWADLNQVEPSRLDAAVEASGETVLGPDQGEEIARQVGAGRFILVRYEPRRSRSAVRAELYATSGTEGLTAMVDTAGAADESFPERWPIDVLLSLFRGQALGVAPGLREAGWIAEPRAMFPYYTALSYESRGELDSALAYLAEAVGIDSTFGAAWDLMAALAVKAEPVATVDWNRRNRYRSIRDTAMAYSARYYSEPEFSPAGLAHAKRLAELFPDSVPLQWSVGMMYWDLALEHGFDPDSARPYLERAAELDSLQDVSRLITFHMIRGRLQEARRLVDRSRRNGVGIYRPDFFETFLEIVEAKTERQRDSVLVASWQKKDPPGAYAVWRTMMIQDSMSIPRRVVEVLTPPESRNSVNSYMRLVELSAGRGAALGALVVEGAPPWRTGWWKSRFYGNVPGVLEEPAGVVATLRETLSAVSYEYWLQELVKKWLLGLLSVRLGDFEGAEDYARAFEQLAADSIPADADSFFVHLAHDFPLEIRAAAEAASGDPQAALQLIEQVHFGDHAPPVDQLGQPANWGLLNRKRPFARLLRADLLFALGRYEEADGWYATFPAFMAPFEDVAFLAPAHRGRARSLDALGRHEEALYYYQRFVTRWQDADPHLQPQVEAARQRIRELEAELADEAIDSQ